MTNFAASAFMTCGVAAALLLCGGAANAADDPRIAQARAKGGVSFYTSLLPAELRDELTDGFKKKTGLPVSIYYGGSGQLVSRITTERQTKSYTVDAMTIADVQLARELADKGVLVKYTVAGAGPDLGAAMNDPGERWRTFAIYGGVLAYNSQQVKAADAPKSWQELADPKWKGRGVIADPARSATGFQMLKVMAADHGWEWVEKLLRNDPLIIGNAAQIDQTIVTGERAAGIMPSMNASDMQKSGAPVAVADIELLFIAPYTTSVVADAPNPEGGQLLVDYLFSDEAAAMYAKYGYFSPKPGAKAPHGFQSLDKLKYRYSEAPAQMSRQEYLDKFNAILQAVRK